MDNENELTIAEAARLTGYSGRHIRRLVQDNGPVKGRRIAGWLYLVDRQSLLAYAEQMKTLGNSKHDPGG